MGDIDTSQLLYVAGIGLILNILLFTVTFLVIYYRCKYLEENMDLEANYQNNSNSDLNASLLDDDHDEDKGGKKKLIDMIRAVKFRELVAEEKTTSFVSNDGCCICLRDGFEEEDNCKVLPECGHVFHSFCIDQWFNTKQTCPVCRMVFRVLVRPVSSSTSN